MMTICLTKRWDKKTKNLHNYALDDIDQNNILFKHEPVDDTPNYSSPPDPLPTFSDIMLPKNKNRGKLVKKNQPKTKTEQGDGEKSREKSPSRTKQGQI